jgi:4-amino-4-deoxy-L-arabinose transferase-like glycosyltransferase
MLTLSHLLGWAGLVKGTVGLAGAWVPVMLGLGMLLHQFTRRVPTANSNAEETPTTWPMLDHLPVMLAGAILVVAACNPPGGLSGMDFGGLWRSEFGGFDALSYHLPIVQEWLASGRLAPMTHNVYSYLPGYVEAAFLHTAVMTGAADLKGGMLADDGWRVLTCQFLHAGFAILAAIWTARLASAWIGESPARRPASLLAAGLTLATPWAVVTGSLAYNDMGVVALSVPLLAVASDGGLSPWRRGLLAGLLLGAAASVKPTAFFLLGAPTAALAFLGMPRKTWVPFVLAGCAAGLGVMLPWLVRNWAACGNPVFPFAHTLFGLSHWSPDQFERYRAAHHESAGLLDRLTLMVFAPASGGQHRGLLHPQWALFFPIVLLGLLAAWRYATTRPHVLRLAVGLAGALIFWLALTHIQSRFLVPMLVPGALAAALGLAAILGTRATFARAAAIFLALTQAGALTVIFAGQNSGQPGAGFAWMPADAAGESVRAVMSNAPSGKRMEFFTKQASALLFVNLALPPQSKVCLVGDATPFYFTIPLVTNTVWDRWPLVDAMNAAPGDPATQGGLWIQSLRVRGITHVLVNLPEIARYRESDYSDPRLTLQTVVDTFVGRAAVVRAWGEPDAPMHILFNITGTSGVASADGGRHAR